MRYIFSEIKVVFNLITVLVLINSSLGFAENNIERLVSPDRKIELNIEIQKGIPVYSVRFNQHQIIRTSSLGFELELPFNGGFEVISNLKGKENEK